MADDNSNPFDEAVSSTDESGQPTQKELAEKDHKQLREEYGPNYDAFLDPQESAPEKDN